MQSQTGAQRREKPEMTGIPVRTFSREEEVAIGYAKRSFESFLRNPEHGLSDSEIRDYLASFDRLLQKGEAAFPREIAEMAVDSFHR